MSGCKSCSSLIFIGTKFLAFDGDPFPYPTMYPIIIGPCHICAIQDPVSFLWLTYYVSLYQIHSLQIELLVKEF